MYKFKKVGKDSRDSTNKERNLRKKYGKSKRKIKNFTKEIT